jgi:acyl carrier protein phosphodiesterase
MLPLLEFANNTYTTLQEHESILPEKLKHMLPYMVRGNWLVNYGNIEGLQRALTGMSRRTSFNSQMEGAVNDLRKHYQEFGDEFVLFFPDLVQYSKDEIEKFQLY